MDQRSILMTGIKDKLITDTTLKALTGYSASNDVVGRPWREGLVYPKYVAVHILSMSPATDAPSTIRVMFDLIGAASEEIDTLRISDRLQYLVQLPEADSVRAYWDFSTTQRLSVKACSWRGTGSVRYLKESKRYAVPVTVAAVVSTVTEC